jgi:hypothetical protein
MSLKIVFGGEIKDKEQNPDSESDSENTGKR